MGLLTVQQSNKNVMCKHSDYIDNMTIFSQALAVPCKGVSRGEAFWDKYTLKILAGATAQATASNRSRLASDTLERTRTNLKV